MPSVVDGHKRQEVIDETVPNFQAETLRHLPSFIPASASTSAQQLPSSTFSSGGGMNNLAFQTRHRSFSTSQASQATSTITMMTTTAAATLSSPPPASHTKSFYRWDEWVSLPISMHNIPRVTPFFFFFWLK